MSNRYLIVFVIFFSITSSSTLAQVRKYERKSISSLGTLNLTTQDVNNDMIENRLKARIHLPRFDYNTISDSGLLGFRNQINGIRLNNPSTKQIAEILNQTIVPQVSSVVKAVAEERALGNLKEEDFAMAAANKLKGSGLTAEDILKVLNAAYLYLPVITQYSEEIKDQKDINVTISGYILWYRVSYAADGSAEATLVQNSASVQTGYASAELNNSYSTAKRSLNGRDYARITAIDVWTKNLNLSMRRLPDFKVSSEVLNINGATPEANIGMKEGLHLDDGYYAEELIENKKGELEERIIGFFRVAKVADNRNNPGNLSSFYPHITSGVERGVLLKEHPQSGLDFFVRPKFFQLRLPKETTPLRVEMLGNYGFNEFPRVPLRFALKDEIREAVGIDLGLHYNIAQQSGVRQLFLTADGGLGAGNASFTPEAPNGISPLIANGYIGVLKKMWLRRANIQVGFSGGVDGIFLQIGNTNEGDLESLSFITASLRLDLGVEYMITPDIMFNLVGNYKFGFPPFLSTLSYKDSSAEDETKQYDVSFNELGFRDTNFNGFTLSVGLSFTLPSFGLGIQGLDVIDY